METMANKATYESVRVLILSHVPKLNTTDLLLDGGSVRNLDVSTLAGRGNLAGAGIILIVGVDLNVAAEEGNLSGEGGPIEVALGLLHGGGGDDAPVDDELGRAGDRSRRHVLDGGCLRILEAEGVGRDGNLRAGAPATLDGLGGDDEAFDAAVKELELDVIVVKVVLGVLPTTVVLPVEAKVPAIPVGISKLPAAVGLVEDDNVLGALSW